MPPTRVIVKDHSNKTPVWHEGQGDAVEGQKEAQLVELAEDEVGGGDEVQALHRRLNTSHLQHQLPLPQMGQDRSRREVDDVVADPDYQRAEFPEVQQ